MQISECRFTPVDDPAGRLLGVANIALDAELVIKGVKLIDGADGTILAMPSRKLQVPCPGCGEKNAIRQGFCGACGRRLAPVPTPECGLFADVCHLLVPSLREAMHATVWEAYRMASEAAR